MPVNARSTVEKYVFACDGCRYPDNIGIPPAPEIKRSPCRQWDCRDATIDEFDSTVYGWGLMPRYTFSGKSVEWHVDTDDNYI